MNTNLKANKILCFGDSNTWGYVPKTAERYPKNLRWTGILQAKLGEDYEIIEEGLNSRTTVIDDIKHIGKNGLTYLVPCLETHNPIDIIILFLGTNDMKERFDRTPVQIAEGIETLLSNIKDFAVNTDSKTPEVILVCPTIIDESVDGVKEKYLGAEEKSKQLPKLYKNISLEHSIGYLNLQDYATPSKKDGYHFDPETHEIVANKIYQRINEIFNYN